MADASCAFCTHAASRRCQINRHIDCLAENRGAIFSAILPHRRCSAEEGQLEMQNGPQRLGLNVPSTQPQGVAAVSISWFPSLFSRPHRSACILTTQTGLFFHPRASCGRSFGPLAAVLLGACWLVWVVMVVRGEGPLTMSMIHMHVNHMGR